MPFRLSARSAFAGGFSIFVDSGGGVTQYTEDDASVGAESLTLAGVVRRDTAASGSGTDGDYSTLATDSFGRLWVRAGLVEPGSGSTNLGKSVDSGSGATDTGVAALAIRDDTLTTLNPSDGDYTLLRTDSQGALWVNAGTGAAQYSEDAAAANGDTGTVSLSVRRDTLATSAGSDGDYATFNTSALGQLYVTAGVDPARQITKAFNATSTQTGTDVWSPASGKKIAITSVVIGTYGTTSARVILWFGDNADTTYSAGTDQLLFAASFAPSATLKPGLVFCPAVPIFCTTADRELHITTDAGISLDIAVTGYEYA